MTVGPIARRHKRQSPPARKSVSRGSTPRTSNRASVVKSWPICSPDEMRRLAQHSPWLVVSVENCAAMPHAYRCRSVRGCPSRSKIDRARRSTLPGRCDSTLWAGRRNHLQRLHTEVMSGSSRACGSGSSCGSRPTCGSGRARFTFCIRRTRHSRCCFASLCSFSCGGARPGRHHSHDLDLVVRMRFQVHRRGRVEIQCHPRCARRSDRAGGGCPSLLGFSILENPRSG